MIFVLAIFAKFSWIDESPALFDVELSYKIKQLAKQLITVYFTSIRVLLASIKLSSVKNLIT